jgi:hypothetical protein
MIVHISNYDCFIIISTVYMNIANSSKRLDGAQGEQPYLRDGLLFYLKQGFYEPGSSPLILQWKDTFSSRYLIYSETQQAVLQVHIYIISIKTYMHANDNKQIIINTNIIYIYVCFSFVSTHILAL